MPFCVIPFLLFAVCLARALGKSAPGDPNGPRRPVPWWALVLFPLPLAGLALPALRAPFLDPEDYFHIVIVQKFLRLSIWEGIRLWVDFFRVRPHALTVSFQFVFHFPLYLAGGLDPMGYRIANLALHATSAWLVALLARRLGVGGWKAVVSGLILLLHPLFPRAILTPTNLTTLLGTCLFLLGLLHGLPTILGPSRPSRGRIAADWTLFLFLYATRQSALVFPFTLTALALLDLSREPAAARRARLRRIAIVAAPMCLFMAAHIGYFLHAASARSSSSPYRPLDAADELSLEPETLDPWLAGRGLIEYLPRDILFPFFPRPDPWFGIAKNLVLALAALACLSGLRSGRRGLATSAGGIALVALGALPFHAALDEQGPVDPILLHLPAAGFAILVTSWVEALPRGRARTALWGCLALALAGGCAAGLAGALRMRTDGRHQAGLDVAFDGLVADLARGEWLTLVAPNEETGERLPLLAMRATATSGSYAHPVRMLSPGWIVETEAPPPGAPPGSGPCLPSVLAFDRTGALVRVTASQPSIERFPSPPSRQPGRASGKTFALCGTGEGPGRAVEAEAWAEYPDLIAFLNRF